MRMLGLTVFSGQAKLMAPMLPLGYGVVVWGLVAL